MTPLYTFKNHKRVIPLCGFEARRSTAKSRSPCSVCVSVAPQWMTCFEDYTPLYFDPPYTAQKYYTTVSLGEWDGPATSLYSEYYRLKVPKTINGVLIPGLQCSWHFSVAYQCSYRWGLLHPPGWEENGLNTEAWNPCGPLNCAAGPQTHKIQCSVQAGFSYTDMGIGAYLSVGIGNFTCFLPQDDTSSTSLKSSYVPYFPSGSEKFNPQDPLVFVFNKLELQKGGLDPNILPSALTFYPAI